MRAQMLLVFLAAWSVGADQPDEKSKKAVDALQGEWVVESARGGPKDAPPNGRKVAIKGNRLTSLGQGLTFQVDPAKTPAHIDFYHDGKLLMRGIYAHAGDKLTLCLGSPSVLEDREGNIKEVEANRPKKFDSNHGFLIVMKRAR